MARSDVFALVKQAKQAKAQVACFIEGDAPIAVYKANAGCFQREVTLQAAKPFCLEPILITSGPYAGLRAIILAPESHFPFERFPPELRQLIYELVFNSYHPVRIGNNGRRHRAFRHRGDTNGQLSLLLVSKLICHEAKPFLYARRHFEFEAMKGFLLFMRSVGTSRRQISSISIERSGVLVTRHCYNFLLDTPKLQAFEFTLPCQFVGTIQEHLKEHWEYLRSYLLADGVSREESLRRLSIISFRVGLTQNSVTGRGGKPCKLITAEMNVQCRRYLRKMLEQQLGKIDQTKGLA